MKGERRRKTHSKSRNGCLQCKKRHVKCDEVSPTCGTCARSDDTCSLPALPTSVSASHTPDAISHGLLGLSNQASGPLDSSDSELMHHGITSTSKTFGVGPEYEDEAQAQIDFQYPYVLYVKLASSALHLFSKQPHRSEVYVRATAHQDAALQLARPHIADTTQEHILPIFVFSGPTSIFALAEPIWSPKSSTRDPIEDLISSFQLGRGIKLILSRHWDYSTTTFVGKVVTPVDTPELSPDLDTTYPIYRELRERVADSCKTADELDACNDAVSNLFKAIARLEAYPDRHKDAKHVQIWAVELKQVYIDMLSQRRPIALAISACYAASTRLRSDTWWLCAWPRTILRRVGQSLGPEWDDILKWPRKRVLVNTVPETPLGVKSLHI